MNFLSIISLLPFCYCVQSICYCRSYYYFFLYISNFDLLANILPHINKAFYCNIFQSSHSCNYVILRFSFCELIILTNTPFRRKIAYPSTNPVAVDISKYYSF